MIVAMAIEDVNMMFRKDRRMEASEITATAKRIVRQFWYMKPEDIKKCFEGRRPKQFVLEGDSFLSWLGDYDLQRDNACENVAYTSSKSDSDKEAVSSSKWLEGLRRKAMAGDKDAAEILSLYKSNRAYMASRPTPEEIRKKEVEFKTYAYRYNHERGK